MIENCTYLYITLHSVTHLLLELHLSPFLSLFPPQSIEREREREMEKLTALLLISMLFRSSATPILGCARCPKHKKPKRKPPVTLPQIVKPPISLPPVTVPPIKPPVTLPPVTKPPTGNHTT